jgi:nucleoside-diphosphate-sugar epimerase
VWRDLLEANIIGTYHLMAAAKKARCRRVVYASSIHAVSGYPAEVQVKTSDPVNPGDLYGVTKCFAEALGRYVAEQEGLSVIAIRIGGFQQVADVQNDDGKFPLINAFVSPRDLHQLFERCIDTENVKFAIFNGLSNNPFNRLDLSDARELVGYEPQDDFTALNPELKPLLLHERLIAHNAMEPGRGKSGMREETGK